MNFTRSLLALALTFTVAWANKGHHTTTHCSSSTTTPPVPCTLAWDICPTGSTCSPTVACPGECYSIGPPPPPEIPCTVGHDTQCPTNSGCTPTMTCPSVGECGGACLEYPPTPTPEVSCTMGGGPCPTGSTCTPHEECPDPTAVCHGICDAIPPSPTATTSCDVRDGDCGLYVICTPSYANCGGLCMPAATPTARPTYTSRALFGGGRYA